MKNQSFALILLLVCAAILAGIDIGNAQTPVFAESPATSEIKIDNFSFTPPLLTVPVGAKVTWTNRDDIPHNIVSTEQKFKSKALDTDEAYAFTFTEPGTYQYFCSIHPRMTGRVVVG